MLDSLGLCLVILAESSETGQGGMAVQGKLAFYSLESRKWPRERALAPGSMYHKKNQAQPCYGNKAWVASLSLVFKISCVLKIVCNTEESQLSTCAWYSHNP